MNSIPSETYREQVRKAIRERTGEPILNGSIDHAAIIIAESFNNAENSIRLLSSKLDPACYARQDVSDAAKCFFLNPDHHARILIESENHAHWKEHPFIEKLKDYVEDKKPQLEIRLVPKALSSTYKYNFLLLDGFGFRFEADRSLPAAVASFAQMNNSPQVKHLDNIFEALWEGSDALSIQ